MPRSALRQAPIPSASSTPAASDRSAGHISSRGCHGSRRLQRRDRHPPVSRTRRRRGCAPLPGSPPALARPAGGTRGCSRSRSSSGAPRRRLRRWPGKRPGGGARPGSARALRRRGYLFAPAHTPRPAARDPRASWPFESGAGLARTSAPGVRSPSGDASGAGSMEGVVVATNARSASNQRNRRIGSKPPASRPRTLAQDGRIPGFRGRIDTVQRVVAAAPQLSSRLRSSRRSLATIMRASSAERLIDRLDRGVQILNVRWRACTDCAEGSYPGRPVPVVPFGNSATWLRRPSVPSSRAAARPAGASRRPRSTAARVQPAPRPPRTRPGTRRCRRSTP